MEKVSNNIFYPRNRKKRKLLFNEIIVVNSLFIIIDSLLNFRYKMSPQNFSNFISDSLGKLAGGNLTETTTTITSEAQENEANYYYRNFVIRGNCKWHPCNII